MQCITDKYYTPTTAIHWRGTKFATPQMMMEMDIAEAGFYARQDAEEMGLEPQEIEKAVLQAEQEVRDQLNKRYSRHTPKPISLASFVDAVLPKEKPKPTPKPVPAESEGFTVVERPVNKTGSQICRSITEKTECRHGVRCKFAHTVSQYKPALCRWGSKCYEKTGTCQFQHPDETVHGLVQRLKLPIQ